MATNGTRRPCATVLITLKVLLLACVATSTGCQEESTGVTSGVDGILVEQVPDNGIQPKMTIDDEDEIHLVYFKPATSNSGDLYYRKLDQSSGRWSDPVRVSSRSYRHQDAISKASIAVDGNGRIHVTWLSHDPFGYRYTRSNATGTAFEKERPVITEHLDGVEAEATVAARDNQVTIAWHAGELIKEDRRTVYAITSRDGGETFGKEEVISDPSLGACGCCGLASFYDDSGRLFVAYRSAIDGRGRHMQVLITDPANPAPETTTREISQWFLEACPVSSNNFALVPTGELPWLAFETRGEILLTPMGLNEMPPVLVTENTEARQKHPAAATNRSGEKLIVWGEAPGYVEGGTLKMALLDADSHLQYVNTPEGITIPTYSVAAVAPLQNGNFLVLY